ncbi:MAG: PAS domain-containing protein [Hyphomicrobiales bacterium]
MTSESYCRARTEFDGQQKIFDYWRQCAGLRRLPSRKDLDPATIPGLLPNICLIDVEPDIHTSVVRLAGSAVRGVYGCEITGKRLNELGWGTRSAYWEPIYRRVISEQVPMIGTVRGPTMWRDHVVLHWLRLPLADEGRQVNKILCYDFVVPSVDQRDEPEYRELLSA